MSPKNLKILAVIFLILLAITVYPVFKTEVVDVIKPVPQNVSLFNERINFDEVSSVQISNGDQKIDIRRHDDGWKVNDKDADEEEVKNLINDLNDMTIGDQVSKNEENQPNFGVDNERGSILKVTSQHDEYEIVVGNKATSDTFYVRKTGSNEVYLAKGSLKQKVSTNEASWRDKVIVSLNKEDITKIEYLGTTRFSLEKNDGKWQYVRSNRREDLEEEDVNKFINLFSPLSAYNFANDTEVTTFNSSRGKITIKIFKDADTISDLLVLEQRDEEADETKDAESTDTSGGTYMIKNMMLEGSDIYKVHSYDISGLTEFLNK